MYTLFFISFVVSSTCFGCYLHPSSGAQLQRTAIGCVSVENRGFSIKWCGGLFCIDLCVLVFQSLAWYLCTGVCVNWICFGIVWSRNVVSWQIVCVLHLCTYGFGVLFHWSKYWPCLSVRVSQTSTCSDGITHKNRNYTNVAHKLSAKIPHKTKTDPITHTPTHKYHARPWKTSTHKSIQNKPPHHLILKPLFSTDTQPMAVRCSCAADGGCK
jgi:hypothetical protein